MQRGGYFPPLPFTEVGVTTERELEIERRLSHIEAWIANQDTKHAAFPAWLFGVISAGVSVAMLILNLYLAGAR